MNHKNVATHISIYVFICSRDQRPGIDLAGPRLARILFWPGPESRPCPVPVGKTCWPGSFPVSGAGPCEPIRPGPGLVPESGPGRDRAEWVYTKIVLGSASDCGDPHVLTECSDGAHVI